MASPVTVDQLAEYVQTDATHEQEFLTECLAEAGELIAVHCGLADIEAVAAGKKIPAATLARAVKETAADLYSRRRARNGIVEIGGDGITPDVVRINRDPMAAARPILRPFLGPGIA